jgi:hypothetical protein
MAVVFYGDKDTKENKTMKQLLINQKAQKKIAKICAKMEGPCPCRFM